MAFRKDCQDQALPDKRKFESLLCDSSTTIPVLSAAPELGSLRKQATGTASASVKYPQNLQEELDWPLACQVPNVPNGPLKEAIHCAYLRHKKLDCEVIPPVTQS